MTRSDAAPEATASAPEDPDAELVSPLRAGDERAFMVLVERYHATMVRVARGYVASRAVAEEVAQEAWLGVLQGIGRFEGRSSLRTWIFRILTNRAKTRGQREARTVPFSSLGPEEAADGPSVDPDRFRPGDDRVAPGGWADPPREWGADPVRRLLDRETLALLGAAIDELPATQREVIVLRDVEGWEATEVCEALELSEGNQRVLLHRARSRVRSALEEHLGREGAS